METASRSSLSTPKLALASRERVGSALPWVRSEPIAVVGMGCRFPGADGPEAFFEVIREGRDEVRELPSGRWDRERYYDPDPSAPGKTYVTRGGYLSDIASFDAQCFGIAPAEALRMDPQQRHLLEVSRHALEHAAIAPESLYGSPVGVFFGISSGDYAGVLRRLTPTEEIDGYVATGNAFSVAAGRLSYILGFTGPSLAVDTACSSSLVSLHLAIQSLRLRECDLALAGGVNLLLEPASTINFAKARMLAPDGRIKAYDARANGFVRGEGCGVVVLKRLSDALAAGDDVWAVVRGSAVNQDGASSALTAPSGTSQRAVLRSALAGASVEPSQVGFVEGHGTGTALGDPIELGALAEVYGESRSANQPLYLGSVKANIGHLESAAGVAGFMKAVLALRHRELPAQINFETPSMHVNWAQSGIEVVRERKPFEPIDGRWLAAVSSFGFSGTNAHVILEAAPALKPKETRPEGPYVITLGARDAGRLEQLAEDWAGRLETASSTDISALVRTAWKGRDRGPDRVAASGATGSELAEGLRAAGRRQRRQGASRGRVRTGTGAGKLAFLFSGQGSAWVGMGMALKEREPAFRSVIERCKAVLGDRVLLDPTRIDPDAIIDTGDAQPALFAFEVAMAELLRSRGIEPDFVLGHSVGELAAACVAGVLELEAAAELVMVRAEQMSMLPSGGKIVALIDEPSRIERAVRSADGEVSVAAFNGPRQTVVSGPAEAVDALVDSLAPEEARTLRVSHAFHSVLMEPALAALRTVTESLRFRPPRIPFVSGRMGMLAGSEIGRPDYWLKQLREPVRYSEAIDTLWTSGVQEFVEVGPGAALADLARTILSDDSNVFAVATSTKRRGEAQTLLDAVAALSVRRDDRDLSPWLGDGPRTSSAPRTSYERTRIWPVESEQASSAEATPAQRLDVAEWGWTPSFRRISRPRNAEVPKGPVLVLGEAWAAELFERLKTRSVPAALGSFKSPGEFDERSPSYVVAFPPDDGSTEWATQLAEYLASRENSANVVIVTSGAHEVVGTESICPHAAVSAAVGDVLGQEISSARVRRIDLDPSATCLPDSIVDDVLAAPDAELDHRVVAYRGRHRWGLDYVSVPLAARSSLPTSTMNGDRVVVIGRLSGGLGERIARYVLQQGAKQVVAVLSESTDDPTVVPAGSSEAIKRLTAAAGDDGRIVARTADIGDSTSLTRALDALETEFGSIDGIIHAGASGHPEIARLLVQKEGQAAKILARERIDGMDALVHAIASRTPRYVLVVTSLAAHVGGVGFADYASANAFAEAYVAKHVRTSAVPWLTVAFEALTEELGHGLDRLDEGAALRSMSLSDQDFYRALDQLGIGQGSHPPMGPVLIVPQSAAKRVESAFLSPAENGVSASARVEGTGAMAARDEVERILVELWEEFLPARPIGVDDDYFALGGTSLAAVQILARMKARFSVEVPLDALLGSEPTIASVAQTVRELQTADARQEVGDVDADGLEHEDAELEELLASVERLSSDEAKQALSEEEPS
ncbi:MAG: SDR family NAD(P)-dependent oxidoreductase [Myxococcota bacterium]